MILPSVSRLWVFPFLTLVVLVSCNKLDRTSIGSELIPGTDRLVTDTSYLDVITTQSPLEFANLDTGMVDNFESHAVGYINDPVFGTTTAAAYFQMLPSNYPFKFPVSKDSLFLDSLVLSLAYTGMYGDTSASNTFSVYRVDDPGFNKTRRYRLNEAPSISSIAKLGTASVNHAKLNSGYRLSYKNDTVSKKLRIRLDNGLGQDLLSKDVFLNDSAFKVFLRGLALIADSSTFGKGVLHYFQLNDPGSRLELYYRAQKTDGKLDTTVAYLPFNATLNRSANANKIHRTLSNSIGVSGNTEVYLLTSPGTFVEVQIQGLENWIGKPYIIHRADLLASQIADNEVSKELAAPVTHLFAINESGQQMPLPYDSVFYFSRTSFDPNRNVFLNAISLSYCGGAPEFKPVNGQVISEYRYNITRYLQNIINRNAGIRSLRISAPYYAAFAGGNISQLPFNPIAAGRVKLGGGAHLTQPMRLRIYYSRP